jgi:hypothetical protein
MRNTEAAFKWIVGLLHKYQIPFQITGGFAGKIYGSTRPLNDIDIDIPDKDFSKILEDIREFIIYGPAHFIDERWDCELMTLKFDGQEIDISGATEMKICDARTGEWRQMPTDFTKSVQKEIYGLTVPVISPQDLITYKSMLIGEHQKVDIKAASLWLK